jgi:diacylglycerol O-acyltransferase / wax synthase
VAHRIPLIDLTFFLLETKDNPTHVAALMVFDLPEGAGKRYVADLAAAYREVPPVAPFSWVPEFPVLGMPRWVKAGALDMKYHVRHTALPAGAAWSDLHELVGELHSQVLDRSRPCFRAYFIEGLPDRQFALFVMVHHAMVDGASAVARITASLDESPDARTVRPIHSIELESAASPAGKANDGLLDGLKAIAAKQAAAVGGLSRSLLQKGMSRDASGAGSAPFTAPRTPMNAPMRAQRSIATLSLPLAEMKVVGKAFGGTINDVAVTIIDAALHRYLDDLGAEPVDRLVAICPVSLREAGDQEATTKASTMYVPLGQRGATIQKRMEAVMQAVASAKTELLAMNKDAAMLYAMGAFGLADLAVRTGATSVTGPVASLFLSNVPGPRTDRYLNGARMKAIYPISALGIGVGLNVTLISYAGSMDFGFVANGVKLPGLERLATHTQEAFAALRRAAARRAPAVTEAAPAAKRAPRREAPAAHDKKTPARGRKAPARA